MSPVPQDTGEKDPVRELKVRAEILHSRLESKDAGALARLRVLPELRRADEAALTSKAAGFRRKHCLAVVARECGFASWEHARGVLAGGDGDGDFGTLLYGSFAGASGILNNWFASHDEARAVLDGLPEDPRHYLLAYKRHFLIVGRTFIETLGLDPDDPDWKAIGFDWARSTDPAARCRLYCRRLAALRGAG